MTTDNRASEHDSTTNPALAVHVSQLVKRYGDMVALDYFDLDVNQGEIFGLLGPNGSGKTTAINCILALLTYDSGTIRVFGQPMTPTSYALKRRIGIVPQNVAVFNELTVTENIDYFCSLYVPKKTDRAPLVEESIEFVGLQDFRKFRPGKLSGGLLRRLNIACGIAHKPNLIFFDEPTATCLTFFEREMGSGASPGVSAKPGWSVWLVVWKTGSAWRRSGRSPSGSGTST